MPALCSQTPHQSPLSGPHGPYDHDRENAAGKERREPASLSDSDAMPFDLLFQPYCWLMFSHWTTNSANCECASHSNEKQGTAALFASQKPGCLQWFQTQPSSSQGSPCIDRTELNNSQGKAEVGAVSMSTTHGMMKGTYTLLNPSADLEFHMLLCRPFWLPREFTAIIITAVYIPPQANTDQALKELYGNISEQETAHPDAAFVVTGDFNKANFRTIVPKYFQHITIVYWTTATLPFGMPTNPSPIHLSVNRITLSFCSCLLIGRN